MSEDTGTDGSRRSLVQWFTGLFADEPSDHSELMGVLRDAAEREVIDADALNIIFGAVQVADMQVRDIMIPRSSLVVVPADGTLEEILPGIIRAKHSRFPVVGEDPDDVKGILHAKDLLPLLLEKDLSQFDIKDCMRPATIVPESKRLNVLLQDFRSTRNHMAVVVDEYGHISGCVTIEDVLEQIVGEIEDEHDVRDEGFVKALDDDTFTVKATTTIEDFNEHFGVDFDDSEFDTIGGILLKAFSSLPERGDEIELQGLRFTVLNADSRRLRLLKVQRGG